MSDNGLAREDKFLTVPELADHWRVSSMTIYRMIRDGKLSCVKIGRSFRIRSSAVEEYTRQHLINVRE